jgi:hypothetical protein
MNKKMFYGCSYRAYPVQCVHATLIKKKIKCSSHKRKFRMEQLQRHIVDTGGKFATGINNISKTGGKICHSVVDTGGNFAAGVVDTGGAP